MDYTHNQRLPLKGETVPCYYQKLDRLIQVKGQANTLKEIAVLTKELSEKNSEISLHDLSMKLCSLQTNISSTVLSNTEKAVLQQCETSLQKFLDRFQTTQGTGLLSRIYGLWLCLYNWWSGNDVHLRQITFSLIGFKSSREIVPTSNDPKEIRLHATDMLIRWMVQEEFALDHMAPVRENQTPVIRSLTESGSISESMQIAENEPINDLFVFSPNAESNQNPKLKNIVTCAQSISEIWHIKRFGSENFKTYIAKTCQFNLSDEECLQILRISTT